MIGVELIHLWLETFACNLVFKLKYHFQHETCALRTKFLKGLCKSFIYDGSSDEVYKIKYSVDVLRFKIVLAYKRCYDFLI